MRRRRSALNVASPLRGLWFAWLNYPAFDVYGSIDTCMDARTHTFTYVERLVGVLVVWMSRCLTRPDVAGYFDGPPFFFFFFGLFSLLHQHPPHLSFSFTLSLILYLQPLSFSSRKQSNTQLRPHPIFFLVCAEYTAYSHLSFFLHLFHSLSHSCRQPHTNVSMHTHFLRFPNWTQLSMCLSVHYKQD